MLKMSDVVLGPAVRASHISRYSTIPVSHRESVAEHSFYVAFFAMLLADDLHLTDADKLWLLKCALVHDMEECLTGDFLRSFKYSSIALRAELEEGAERAAKATFDEIHKELSHWYVNAWRQAKNNTIAGQVIRYADFLSVVMYLSKEAASGNRYAETMIRGELRSYWDLFNAVEFRRFDNYQHQLNHILENGWKEVRVTV